MVYIRNFCYCRIKQVVNQRQNVEIEKQKQERCDGNHITTAVTAMPQSKKPYIRQKEAEEREAEILAAQRPATVNNHRQHKTSGHNTGKSRRVLIIDRKEREKNFTESLQNRLVEIGNHLREHLADARHRTHLGTPWIDRHDGSEITGLYTTSSIAQRPGQEYQHNTPDCGDRGFPLFPEQEKQNDGKQYRCPYRADVISRSGCQQRRIKPRRAIKCRRFADSIKIE